MLTMAINGMGGYLRPGADREQLDYHRGDENPLPEVPTTAASEQTVDPRPQPINPASEPVDLARAIISGARGNSSNDKENGGAR